MSWAAAERPSFWRLVAMAVGALLLAAAHLFGTTPFDLLFWTLLALSRRAHPAHRRRASLVCRPAWSRASPCSTRTSSPSLPSACLPASRWPVRGACWPRPGSGRARLLAGLLWTPYLVWQAQHGWPAARRRPLDRGRPFGDLRAALGLPALPARARQPLPRARLDRRPRAPVPRPGPALLPRARLGLAVP